MSITTPSNVRCSRTARSLMLVLNLVGILLASPLLLAGCGSSADPAAAQETQQPRRGGTVWFETAQEPPVLNTYLAAGGMSITDVLTTPLKSQWVRIDDEGRFEPMLATSVPTPENGGVHTDDSGRMHIEFAIDSRAKWSDGVAITCEDMRFTWQTIMDQRWAIGSRIGWELIERVECESARSVHLVLSQPHAPYLTNLLVTAPLPAHALRGKDFDRVWSNAITVSSGPFEFVSWKRGDRLEMRRNPRYWRAGNKGLPYLDRIVVRFVPDANTMKLDLRMEDADVIGLPPDTNLPQELASIPTADFDVRPGAGWENLTMNTRAFPLNDARVRQAVAYAVDRNTLVDVVLKGQVPRLDSTLLPYQQPYYAPTFTQYRRDLSRVEARMQSAGFTRDSAGRWRSADGTLAKLTLTTMTGNPLRLKSLQLIAAQLEQSGFATELMMIKPEVFFSQVVARGEYHLAVYAFTQGVDPSQSKVFACSEIARAPAWTGKNNSKYCRKDVDALLQAADRSLDVRERARITRELGERLASDVPTLPLYQQPDTLAWSKRVHNVRPNAMGRHLWNLDEWWVTNP